MRPFTPLKVRSVLLAVLMAASGFAWAQPFGYGINSRGDFKDDARVGALWTINLATGEADREGRTRISNYIFIEGLSFGPDVLLYGVDDDTNTLIRIGLGSGNAVPVGGDNNLGLPAGNHDFGMTFTCSGDLLMTTDSNDLGRNLYSVNPETGETTLIGDLGVPIVDMASLGNRVFGIGRGMDAAGNPESPNLYLIDPVTPSATLVGPLGGEADLYNKAGLAADSGGNLWAVTERRDPGTPATSIASQILLVDPETGLAERQAETTTATGSEALVGIESLAIAPAGSCSDSGTVGDVPEIPVMSERAYALLVIVLFALGLLRLRAGPA